MTDIVADEVNDNIEELGARLPVEFRRVQELDVRYPERVISLIAAPYDAVAFVSYKGRMIQESFAPGSFDGIERRANRIKVNREHVLDKPIGRALAFYPSRTEGLVADLRISHGPNGDEALDLAADGVLDASVGFAPFPGHEGWNASRSGRHITKAYLHHIALTSDPAYEGAHVLEVRRDALEPSATRVGTPNLDQVRSWLLQDRLTAAAAGHPSAHVIS
jgi:HK97 family phage prohead protease